MDGPESETLTALIMAGGSGQRMRASGMPIAKPLVPALGVPLLERNLHALLRAGFKTVIVAASAGLPEVAAFVRGRLTALGRAGGAEVECFVEQTPLGNIGCAGLFRDRTRALLVVYADNLTTLNLRAMMADHRRAGADMTIATHKQPFRMPFGEVRIEGDEVRAYVEKPTYAYDVCSAVSVLGPAALDALPADRPTGLSNLVQQLINGGRRVRAYPHAVPWIDINDGGSLAPAEALIAANQHDFDLWASDPPPIATLLCEFAGEYVRLIALPGAGAWTLPELDPGAPDPVMLFDDLDDRGASVRRFAVARSSCDSPGEGAGSWRPVAHVLADDRVSAVARRAVAFASRLPERR